MVASYLVEQGCEAEVRPKPRRPVLGRDELERHAIGDALTGRQIGELRLQDQLEEALMRLGRSGEIGAADSECPEPVESLSCGVARNAVPKREQPRAPHDGP